MPHSILNHSTSSLLVWIFLCTVPGAGGASQAEPVVAGLNAFFPPYEFVTDAGTPSGFNVELLEAVAAAERIPLHFRWGRWSDIRTALESGRITVATGMLYSAERDEVVDFSTPFLSVEYSIFVRSGIGDIADLNDLRGRRVAVVRGTLMHDLLDGIGFRMSIVPLRDEGEVLDTLASGRADAALLPYLVSLRILAERHLEGIEAAGPPVRRADFGFAVAEGDVALLKRLNTGLRTVREDGTYRRLYNHWFGRLPSTGAGHELLWRTTAYVVFPLLALILASLAWSWSLRRQVAQRTRALNEELEAHRRDRQERLASEQKFAKAFQATPDAVTISSLNEGRFIEVNESFLKLSGYDLREVIGRSTLELGMWPDPEKRRQVVERLQASGHIRDLELTFRIKDGSELICLFSGEVIRLDGRDCLIAVTRDVTRQRLAEEHNRRLEARLRQAQKLEAVGQLAGGVAHDFNNILASILGYTGLALERFGADMEPRLRGYLEEVRQAGERARDLIRQMLAFSRGSMGEAQALSPVPLVKEASRMLRSTLPSSIALDVHTDPDTPRILIDPTQLHQVVMNLIVNARDAIGVHGRIEIAVRPGEVIDEQCDACGQAVSGLYVVIAVSDTGSGIDPQVRERMFDPYFTTKEQGRGTGMGLSVVQGIVHDHGGHIVVDDAPGGGSRFRALFPAARDDAASGKGEGATEVRSGPGAAGARIMVVDDEETVIRYMAELLEARGYQVTAIAGAREALEMLRDHPAEFDLLITDQTMPELTGVELAARVRALGLSVPIVLYTGNPDPDLEARCGREKISACLSKPLQVDGLTAAIGKVLGGDRPRQVRPGMD